MAYWDANRAVFRVVELATEEGDLRFQGLRVRALNAVTVTLARVIASGAPEPQPGGGRRHGRGGHAHLDARPRRRPPLRVRVLGHPHHGHGGHPGARAALGRHGPARPADADDAGAVPAPRTGPVVGGGAAQTRVGQARRRPGPEVPPRRAT